MLDVYTCSCGNEFAVKEAKVPRYCPFCANKAFDFSHEIGQEEE